MATITLEVPDDLARRLENAGEKLPDLLAYALDLTGVPGKIAFSDLSQPPWNARLAVASIALFTSVTHLIAIR